MHKKLLALHQYIPFSSEHLPTTRIGLSFEIMIRYWNQNSSPHDYSFPLSWSLFLVLFFLSCLVLSSWSSLGFSFTFIIYFSVFFFIFLLLCHRPRGGSKGGYPPLTENNSNNHIFSSYCSFQPKLAENESQE